MEEFINALISEELKPALGCTEPIAVALTASYAGKALRDSGDEPEKIFVELDKNVFKNGKVVSIPAPEPMRGNLFAAPLGALLAKPESGFQLLQSLDLDICKRAREMVDKGNVQVKLNSLHKQLFIQVKVSGKNGHVAIARSQKRHDNLVYLSIDEQILLEKNDSEVPPSSQVDFSKVSTREFFRAISHWIPTKTVVERLQEGIAMNLRVMEAGLTGYGTGVGKRIGEIGTVNCSQNKLISKCSAAVDARMSGFSLPVMSVTGSGNQGLLVFLLHHLYAECYKKTEVSLYRALIFAIFLASRIKSHSGRLSALCGCVISSGLAGSASLCMLENLDYEVAEASFHIMAADIMGILCDGAKASCALKAATGINSLLRSLKLAASGFKLPLHEGIIGNSIDDTIINIGKIANPGMVETDVEILKILQEE
ncbi:MAG: serine dehydratase subunit alpha family protein [Candidatus Riflebacteria bacterium]|nr:serine dehydratase subunit alpha family protein [Candidatus Riflebacteria bacterium]